MHARVRGHDLCYQLFVADICVRFGNIMFLRLIGIPIGTKSADLIADFVNHMTLNVAHLTLNVAQCCTTAICRNVNAKCRTLLSAQLCIFSYMCHHVCNEVGVRV
jgi:hypothetical protein